MNALRLVTLVIAAGWLLATWASARAGRARTAAACAALAGAHAVAAIRPAATPLVLAAWLLYGLAVPSGRLATRPRALLAGAGTAALAGWAAVLLAGARQPSGRSLVAAALAVIAIGCSGAALRCSRALPQARQTIQWLAAASVLAAASAVLVLALHVLLGSPGSVREWLIAPLALVPIAQVLALWPPTTRWSAAALAESIVVSGLTALVVGVYLVVVVGLNRAPVGGERDVLFAGMVAAVVVAVLAIPVRHRLSAFATALVGQRDVSAEEVVATFGARMSRAVPMDELMLQLAESLRATIATGGAEVWVGADGVLTRTVSVPHRPAERIQLGERERIVVGRARIGGPSWASVWLPQLLGPDGELRVAPVAHLGDLLGMIVARRPPDAAPFSEDDDRQLVELARQLGLALHNVRLDSALQASLAELEQRNAELAASRLRIVTAADESRRAIERNLHDGAQQHLVALAVKLGLASELAEDDPSALAGLLEQLRGDVRVTIAELRELAHGIYPPLLRDRGLGEALRTAAARSTLPCEVDVNLPGRYPPEVETAAYFCCLEAVQNAGKYAGAGASICVQVGRDDAGLWFSVRDDGQGFDAGAGAEQQGRPPHGLGHGFVNMQDRLGAIGGQLRVESAPGQGTTIRATIPARALTPRDEVVTR